MRTIPRRNRNLILSAFPRQKVLSDLSTLYSLFPGVKPGDMPDFGSVPKSCPIEYSSDLSSVQEASLRNSFFKKFAGFSGGSPKEEAKKKFLFYEDRCRQTNLFLKALRSENIVPGLNDILFVAQRKISNVLGRFDLDEFLSLCCWGPGVTSSCKGPDVSDSAKFRARPDCTGQSLFWVRLCLPLLPSWSALLADQDYGCIVNPITNIVAGNKVTFVPKTAVIDRTIAIEPHLNIFFQGGLGRLIRRRMRQHAKVDLSDQSTNRRLAQLGSKDNSLATIDLEGASDTISLELVRDLLPPPWFEILDAFRSHFGELDGDVFRYHKFSSMGNGATFDLESLIFWALSSAVVESLGYNPFWVNVFGDDIIIPSGAYDKVAQTLELLGFIVNKEKSFSDGPFRESCGEDYFLGINVRPVYLKKVPRTEIDWIVIANQIRTLAHRWALSNGCDSRLLPAYLFAVSRIPRLFRQFKVPARVSGQVNSLADGLHVNFDEAAPSLVFTDETRSWSGYLTRTIQTRTVKVERSDRSLVTSAVSKPSCGGNMIALRDKVYYREGTSFVPNEWYDLGPWW